MRNDSNLQRLYADFIFTPNWEFVMVHFVVCGIFGILRGGQTGQMLIFMITRSWVVKSFFR